MSRPRAVIGLAASEAIIQPVDPDIDAAEPHGSAAADIAKLAVLYALAGWAGLQLATPPGHASPVWPASGLALLFVLVRGSRTWPGIFLASFLLNALQAAEGGTDTAPAIALGLAMAAGAVLQALLGASLVRNVAGFPTPLEKEMEIVRFVLLAGPVASVVAPTLGVASLRLTGVLAAENVWFNWLTWWVGDMLGVLVVVPVGLAFFGAPHAAWRRRRGTVALPLGLFFAASVLLFHGEARSDAERTAARFERQCDAMRSRIGEQLHGALDALYGIERLFASRSAVARREFEIFNGRSATVLPSLQAVEWCPRVPHASRAAMEHAARMDGLAGYRIFELAPGHGFASAAARAEYYPVLYAYPGAANLQIPGFDLASREDRRVSIQAAIDSAAPAVSGAVTLVQNPLRGRGVLVVLPVYAAEPPPSAVSARRASARGCVVAVLRVNTLVERGLSAIETRGIEVSLEERAGQGWRPLHRTRGFEEATARLRGASALERHHEQAIGGQTWRLTFRGTQEFSALHRTWQPWTVLTGTSVLTAALGIFLLVLTGRTSRIEQMVAARTADLSRANEELAREVAERTAAQRTAEASMQARSRFLANVGHELRTPLNAILGYCEIVIGDVREAGQTHYLQDLQRIEQAGRHLLTLINDLLEITRGDAAIETLHGEPVAFDALVTELGELGRTLAERNGATFVVAVDPELPGLRTDERRLRRCLTILVQNACSFTRQGEVRLSVSGAPGAMVFEVTDPATALTSEELRDAFEPFAQQESGAARLAGGAGLALALAVQLAGRIGATLTVHPGTGQGNVFRLAVPIEPGRERDHRKPGSSPCLSAAGMTEGGPAEPR